MYFENISFLEKKMYFLKEKNPFYCKSTVLAGMSM